MPAQNMNETTNLNHLRRGDIYRATTADGTTLGEYLGMEALYGQRAVMLRGRAGTASLIRDEILSIELAA